MLEDVEPAEAGGHLDGDVEGRRVGLAVAGLLAIGDGDLVPVAEAPLGRARLGGEGGLVVDAVVGARLEGAGDRCCPRSRARR